MKVKDLIILLQEINPELEVFLEGYEGGYKQFHAIDKAEDFVLNVNTEDKWWYGPHERVKDVDNPEGYTVVKGVVLK